ncbi:unnamed protein product [Caenorhabditis nigoni]
MLSDYSTVAKSSRGAILFAVMGGKMSEGINFSDELDRAVIVIGLPYSNKTGVELRERMRFLDSQMGNGGNMSYESMCMHSVNQSIGRAIRHREDTKIMEQIEVYTIWKFGHPEIWKFGHPDIWKFGHLEIWKFGHPDIWKFGHPEIWKFGHPDIWKFGNLDIRKSGNSGIRKSGNLEIRTSGNLEVRTFRHLDIRKSGNSNIQKSGHLGIRKSATSDVRKFGNLEVRTSRHLEIRKSGHQEVWKFGHPEIRKSGTSDIRKSRSSDIQTSGHPEIWKFEHPEIRTSGNPEIWNFGRPEIRKSGTSDIRTSGKIWKFGNLDIRKSGNSDVRKFGNLRIRKSGTSDIRKSGTSDIQTSANSEIWTAGSLEIRASGNPGIWESGNLELRKSGNLEASETGQKAGTDFNIMYAVNDMVGRVVLINTTDNKRWSGVLSAISPEFEFGVELVVEVTKENENHLLRQEKDVIEKMTFKFDDIVYFAYITEEDKKNQFVSKFATDRQYHGDVVNENEELQAWNGGDDEEGIGESIEDGVDSGPQSSRRNDHNNGASGWSVNEMFAVNEKLKVVSTFKEDMTQYTTVDAVGTEEDRARAERIAREIESDISSKFMANLENDDDERDLDKSTRHDENFYNQAPQNPNISPNEKPIKRRTEELREDRNSGGSSANNSRYGAQASTQNYQPPQQQEQKSGSHNNWRQNDDYRENDWQMAKGKGQNQGQDHSFRQQQEQMLDPRPSAKQPEGEKGQNSESRVTELKNWDNEFSIATSPKEQSPAPGSTPPVSQGNSGSAWNRGPPSSLVTKGASTASVAEKEIVEKPVPQTKEELPSTSAEGQTETDGRPDETDNVSVTGRPETSSVSKSQFFKFNINAPEFKPRAAPPTPTPTTPTGPGPQGVAPVQQQQFITQEYQQHPGLIPQGPPPPQQLIIPGEMMPHVPQGHQRNQQYTMQLVPGTRGTIYGCVVSGPTQVNQQCAQNQQMPPNTGTDAQNDGSQGNQQARRGDGKSRRRTITQPMFYSQYSQAGQMMPVPRQFYQYQGGAPQQQYQMMVVPQMQQAPQGQYQQRYQQNSAYMGGQQGYQGPPPQQAHQFAGEHGGTQSHPNGQPNTPEPRGELNGQKMQPQGQPTQPQNNNGVQRVPEAGSGASISGSASSQSGQRSGSPQTNNTSGPPQQQQQQHPQQQQQGPQWRARSTTTCSSTTTHAATSDDRSSQSNVHSSDARRSDAILSTSGMFLMPAVYYGMMPVSQMQQMPNQHVQPSLMGEQQQHQMHGGHMPPRQNSIPQQFGGNQGVNPSSQQAPPPAPQLHQQGGPPPPQQQPQSPQ